MSNRQIIKLLKRIEKNTRPVKAKVETRMLISNPDTETTLSILGDRFGIITGPQGPPGPMGPQGDTVLVGNSATDPFQGRTGRDPYIEESDDEYDARMAAQYGTEFDPKDNLY